MPSHLKFGCLVEAPDPTLAWWAIGCIQPIYTFRFINTSQFTHAGRVQRAAGATYPGGGLRPCVHGAGKGEPPGREDPPCRRAEKQRADVQLLPESKPLFRAVAVFPREPGYPQGHFPSCSTGGYRPRSAAGTKERGKTSGITPIRERQNQFYKHQIPKPYEYESEHPL